jgi:hypothetical protein
MPLAQLLEPDVSLGVFALAAGLGGLNFLVCRRERNRRVRTVTLGDGLFAVCGLIVFSTTRCFRISRMLPSDCSNPGIRS